MCHKDHYNFAALEIIVAEKNGQSFSVGLRAS